MPARVVESSLAPPVDEEIGLQVVERLAVGRSLEEIASVPGMPSKEVFLIWLAMSPLLAQAFKRAQEVSAFAMEDEVLYILRKQQREPTAVTQNSLRANQQLAEHLRWAVEKRNPAVYAKQAHVNTTVPIQINTTLDLGGNTGTGTAEFPNIYALKAAKVEVVDLEPEPEATPAKKEIVKKDSPEYLAKQRAMRAKYVREYRARRRAREKEAAANGGS